MSYIFLIGPEAFHHFAQAEIQYSQLSTAAWGNDGDVLSYVYDENGSQVYKVYATVSNIESMTPPDMATWLTNNPTVNYDRSDYNLQNRLSTLTKVHHGADTVETVVGYTYDPSGNRTSAETTITVNSTVQEHKLTDYLVDPSNHTGYAQVLEETTVNQLDMTDAVRIQYTLGDDVISQTKSIWNSGTSLWVAADTQYLLYDGHGSTRQLARPNKSVIESYSYDGYGVILGTAPDAADSAQTNLLYCGEQYDKNLSQYYLRARYYNPQNGLFNQKDPYEGNTQEPQSLHKYLYVHNNPVNAIDPTGEFGFIMSATLLFSASIFESIAIAYKGLKLVDIAYILNGLPLSYETILDLTKLWAKMSIQLSGQQMSRISSTTQVLFEMAVMYVIDMTTLVMNAGLDLAILRLSVPSGSSGKSTTVRILAKASEGAQEHHILSTRILRALNSHPNLAGIFKRTDPRLIFKAASNAAHRGYQLWHRSVDDVIVNWIRNNPNAGKTEFVNFLRKVYQNSEISARIPKVFLWNL